MEAKNYAIRIESQQHWIIVKKMMKSSGVLVPGRRTKMEFEHGIYYAVCLKGYLKFMEKEEVLKNDIAIIRYYGTSTPEKLFFGNKINSLKFPFLSRKCKTVSKFLKLIGDSTKDKTIEYYTSKMEKMEAQLTGKNTKKMKEEQYLEKLKNFISPKCQDVEINRGMWRFTFFYTINGVKKRSSVSRLTIEQHMTSGTIPLTIKNILKNDNKRTKRKTP